MTQPTPIEHGQVVRLLRLLREHHRVVQDLPPTERARLLAEHAAQGRICNVDDVVTPTGAEILANIHAASELLKP